MSMRAAGHVTTVSPPSRTPTTPPLETTRPLTIADTNHPLTTAVIVIESVSWKL